MNCTVGHGQSPGGMRVVSKEKVYLSVTMQSFSVRRERENRERGERGRESQRMGEKRERFKEKERMRKRPRDRFPLSVLPDHQERP